MKKVISNKKRKKHQLLDWILHSAVILTCVEMDFQIFKRICINILNLRKNFPEQWIQTKFWKKYLLMAFLKREISVMNPSLYTLFFWIQKRHDFYNLKTKIHDQPNCFFLQIFWKIIPTFRIEILTHHLISFQLKIIFYNFFCKFYNSQCKLFSIFLMEIGSSIF